MNLRPAWPLLKVTHPLRMKCPRVQMSGVWWLPTMFLWLYFVGFLSASWNCRFMVYFFFREFRRFSVIIPSESPLVSSFSSVTPRTSEFDPMSSSPRFLRLRTPSVCTASADWSESELHWPVLSLSFSPRLSPLFHWAHRARFSNFSYCVILALRCPFGIFLNAHHFFAEVFWLVLFFSSSSSCFKHVHNSVEAFVMAVF